MVKNLKLSEFVTFGLRMPPELKRQVRQSARENNRSMNAEINHLIELGLANRAASRAAPGKVAVILQSKAPNEGKTEL